ncbi:MAG: hypothetical protein J7K66_05605 [Anaerolineaceae bacterium]|nr:hypothetical protein [Anaerolineaceae bacterium]
MGREFWIGLIVGLIIGWFIEWVIDWFCWRKKYQTVVDQLENKKDDLKEIKGIGKIIEKRLNDAGIFTFKRLSELNQQEIEKIIGKAQNLTDEKSIIVKAKKKAIKKSKKKKK